MINSAEANELRNFRKTRESIVTAKKNIDQEMRLERRAPDAKPEQDPKVNQKIMIEALRNLVDTKSSSAPASVEEQAAVERALSKVKTATAKTESKLKPEAAKGTPGKKISAEEAWRRAVNKEEVLNKLKPLAEQGNQAAVNFIASKMKELGHPEGGKKISAEEAWKRSDANGKLEIINRLMERAKSGDAKAREFILHRANEIKKLQPLPKVESQSTAERPVRYQDLSSTQQQELDRVMKQLRVKYHPDIAEANKTDVKGREEILKKLEDSQKNDVRRFVAQAKLFLGQKIDIRI